MVQLGEKTKDANDFRFKRMPKSKVVLQKLSMNKKIQMQYLKIDLRSKDLIKFVEFQKKKSINIK